MDVYAMKAELHRLNEEAGAIAKRRSELRQQIADATAVFPVGSRVTYDGAKHVWEIVRIDPGRYGGEVAYIGAKLKKDGTPGALHSEIWVPYKATLRAA